MKASEQLSAVAERTRELRLEVEQCTADLTACIERIDYFKQMLNASAPEHVHYYAKWVANYETVYKYRLKKLHRAKQSLLRFQDNPFVFDELGHRVLPYWRGGYAASTNIEEFMPSAPESWLSKLMRYLFKPKNK